MESAIVGDGKQCGLLVAWVGPCKEPRPCRKHANWACVSCKGPATHECDASVGMVCGAPLCDACEHKLSEDGANVFAMKHCRKADQEHEPWFSRAGRGDLGVALGEQS